MNSFLAKNKQKDGGVKTLQGIHLRLIFSLQINRIFSIYPTAINLYTPILPDTFPAKNHGYIF